MAAVVVLVGETCKTIETEYVIVLGSLQMMEGKTKTKAF